MTDECDPTVDNCDMMMDDDHMEGGDDHGISPMMANVSMTIMSGLALL